MLINLENKKDLPFKYFSPSSIIEFLTNEKSFFEKYVLYNWSEKTGPALLIGTAYHSALEFMYTKEIKKEKTTDSEILNEGINSLTKLFTFHEKRGLEKLIEIKNWNSKKELGEKAIIIDFEKWQEKLFFLQTLSEDFEKSKELIDKKKRAEFTVYRNGFITDEEIESYKTFFIDFGKTGSKKKAMKDLIIAINNYLENKPTRFTPEKTEIKDVGEFLDFEGKEMPIALKGMMDLLARDEKGNLIIIDHKCVSLFGSKNGAYEIQAGAYYFIAQAITGEKPTKMIFNECIKKALSPSKGLLKKDLVKMCQDNKLDDKGIVEDLQIRLLDKGILKPQDPINPIVIDYEKEPEIIQSFIEIYKEILNRSFYYFIEKSIKFIPNIKADYTGESTWRDYKNETVNDIDIIQDFQDRNKKDQVDLQF